MNEMKLSDFNYELPQELIAQDPLLKRSDIKRESIKLYNDEHEVDGTRVTMEAWVLSSRYV